MFGLGFPLLWNPELASTTIRYADSIRRTWYVWLGTEASPTRSADLETQHAIEEYAMMSVNRRHFPTVGSLKAHPNPIKFTMKLAVFSTLIASAAAFSVNKADVVKVRNVFTFVEVSETEESSCRIFNDPETRL